jgi:hypothetical protein
MRAKIILQLSEEMTPTEVGAAQHPTTKTVHRWRNPFEAEGVGGLVERPRSTHDYKRNGTASLYAVFNTLNGNVIGKVADKANGKEFSSFLKLLNRRVKAGKERHIILEKYEFPEDICSARMAGSTSAHPPPIYAHRFVVAERCRGLVLTAGKT